MIERISLGRSVFKMGVSIYLSLLPPASLLSQSSGLIVSAEDHFKLSPFDPHSLAGEPRLLLLLSLPSILLFLSFSLLILIINPTSISPLLLFFTHSFTRLWKGETFITGLFRYGVRWSGAWGMSYHFNGLGRLCTKNRRTMTDRLTKVV